MLGMVNIRQKHKSQFSKESRQVVGGVFNRLYEVEINTGLKEKLYIFTPKDITCGFNIRREAMCYSTSASVTFAKIT